MDEKRPPKTQSEIKWDAVVNEELEAAFTPDKIAAIRADWKEANNLLEHFFIDELGATAQQAAAAPSVTHRAKGGKSGGIVEDFIELGRQRARKPFDKNSVWDELEEIVRSDDRPKYILGLVAAGIQYRTGGRTKTLSPEALRKHLGRLKDKQNAVGK